MILRSRLCWPSGSPSITVLALEVTCFCHSSLHLAVVSSAQSYKCSTHASRFCTSAETSPFCFSFTLLMLCFETGPAQYIAESFGYGCSTVGLPKVLPLLAAVYNIPGLFNSVEWSPGFMISLVGWQLQMRDIDNSVCPPLAPLYRPTSGRRLTPPISTTILQMCKYGYASTSPSCR